MAACPPPCSRVLLTGRALAAPGSSTPRYLVDQDRRQDPGRDRYAVWSVLARVSIPPGTTRSIRRWRCSPSTSSFTAGQDGSDPTDIQPLLADGMPTLSDDLLTATIKLRQGIKFQNTGNEMTADDVIFSFKRLAATYAQSSFLATDYWTDIQKADDYTDHVDAGGAELRSRRGAGVRFPSRSPIASRSSNSAARPTGPNSPTRPPTMKKRITTASSPTRMPRS